MNYGVLKADTADYLHRSDLTSQIPKFIEKARTRIMRDCRALELEATATLSSPTDGVFQLPADFQEIRRVYSAGVPLRSVNPHELEYWTSLSTPQVYCIRNREITVPGATTVDVWYWKAEATLANDATEHPTMLAHPQLWQAATLYEAALYLTDSELVATWSAVYRDEVERINRRANRARVGAAPASINSDAYGTFFEARN